MTKLSIENIEKKPTKSGGSTYETNKQQLRKHIRQLEDSKMILLLMFRDLRAFYAPNSMTAASKQAGVSGGF